MLYCEYPSFVSARLLFMYSALIYFFIYMLKHICALFILCQLMCMQFFAVSPLLCSVENTQHSLRFSPDPYRFLFIQSGPSWERYAYQIIPRPTFWISNFSCWYIKKIHIQIGHLRKEGAESWLVHRTENKKHRNVKLKKKKFKCL